MKNSQPKARPIKLLYDRSTAHLVTFYWLVAKMILNVVKNQRPRQTIEAVSMCCLQLARSTTRDYGVLGFAAISLARPTSFPRILIPPRAA